MSARHYGLVPDVNRRAVLRMGVGASAAAAGMWALSALLDPLQPQAAPWPLSPAPFEPSTASSNLPTKLEWLVHLGGARRRPDQLGDRAAARAKLQSGMLRPVIALHGKDGNANMMLECGVEDGLAQLVKEGRPPFAVVGVDGGTIPTGTSGPIGGDSGAMVLDELLPMLGSMGMDTSRVGFMGWSMGGYGALRLGAELGPVADRGDLRDQPGAVHVVRR